LGGLSRSRRPTPSGSPAPKRFGKTSDSDCSTTRAPAGRLILGCPDGAETSTRKALNKELGKARAMTGILAAQSAEMRAKAETMLQQADRLLCESWNERMWSCGN
jgi:hypothetical protein